MKIIRADHLGMCFGVRDAIHLAREEAGKTPLTILGELVHNSTVLNSLRSHGVQFETQPQAVTTSTVMITAHGASERARAGLRQHGFNVLEATCPLVHFAHDALRKLVDQGCYPVIVGKTGHVEVRGLTEDLDEYSLVLEEEDIDCVPAQPLYGVIAQTTQPIERARHLVALLKRRFPNSEVRFRDTVCQPTKQRQSAAVDLARRSDVVVVVGGANSNNTRELAETCRAFCPRVFQVQSASELSEEWFDPGDTVGITAGTSTPDVIIHAVEKWLENLARQTGEEEMKAKG